MTAYLIIVGGLLVGVVLALGWLLLHLLKQAPPLSTRGTKPPPIQDPAAGRYAFYDEPDLRRPSERQ
jgi:hypothetical protein